ncbi:hypothetical protein BKA69DRAFT_199353 [Paraphysoderma sedebokerense]|nr:hypothetical protein BKA69DRAFT_199353 [Paraphysoderma sedebokerense]
MNVKIIYKHRTKPKIETAENKSFHVFLNSSFPKFLLSYMNPITNPRKPVRPSQLVPVYPYTVQPPSSTSTLHFVSSIQSIPKMSVPRENTTSPIRYDHDENEEDGESDVESEGGSDGEKRYEIEKITAQRRNPDGTINYFVQWLNYPPEASTWEPIQHFESQKSLEKVLKTSGKVYWVDYHDTIVDGFTIQKWLRRRNNKRYREKVMSFDGFGLVFLGEELTFKLFFLEEVETTGGDDE